jgi:outer membrane protein assembly factor BamB
MNINNMLLRLIITLSFSFLFLILLISWIRYKPAEKFTENVPGMDNRENVLEQKKKIKIGEYFLKGNGVPSKIKGDFSRFRGDNYDNIVNDNIIPDWNSSNPEKLWEIELGEGYASPVIRNGMVYILDYNEIEKSDSLKCLSLSDGTLIWERSYNVPVKRNHGMSRTVCSVTDKYAVSIGPRCQVMCVDSNSGDFLWGIDLIDEFGAVEPLWYTGQCPLVDNGRVILGVGGRALMICADCRTGKILWQVANPDNWKMTHSSILPVTIDNVKMFVYTATGGIIGVDDMGRLLWKSDSWVHSIIVPSPVYCGNGKLFFTAGYGAGSMMLQVYLENSVFKTRVLYSYKPDQGLASEQQTPIFYKGLLYSVNPDDGGVYKNQLVCSDLNGRIIWSSGVNYRFGLGPYMIAGDKILLLTENGDLNLIEASAKSFKLLATEKILDGVEAWGPLCYVNGRLLARDSKKLVCLNVNRY